MTKYHLDTNVLVDMERRSRNVAGRIRNLAEEGHELEVSVLVVAEYYSGSRLGVRPRIDEFIASLMWHEVTAQIAERGAAYRFTCARRGTPVSLVDALLSATALTSDASLVTRDSKIVAIDGLKLLAVADL